MRINNSGFSQQAFKGVVKINTIIDSRNPNFRENISSEQNTQIINSVWKSLSEATTGNKEDRVYFANINNERYVLTGEDAKLAEAACDYVKWNIGLLEKEEKEQLALNKDDNEACASIIRKSTLEKERAEQYKDEKIANILKEKTLKGDIEDLNIKMDENGFVKNIEYHRSLRLFG